MDYVAWKHYGRTDARTVERVLEANHGLADLGTHFPAGVLINLPELPPAPEAKGLRLWD